MGAQIFCGNVSEKTRRIRAATVTGVGLGLCGLLLVGVGGRLAKAAGTPAYHLLKKHSLGGDGGWDYLSVDSQARRLYISRGDRVGTETWAIRVIFRQNRGGFDDRGKNVT